MLYKFIAMRKCDDLPDVTEDDNGMILTVVDGKWVPKKAEFFVPITQEEYDALVESGDVDETKYYMIVG